MADETPEKIRSFSDYIDNAGTSVLIPGWGAPFVIWLETPAGQPAKGISVARRVCYINGDPFAGKTELSLLGIYPSEQEAEIAVASAVIGLSDTVAYAHYRGPENVILPTMVTTRTAPRLVATMKRLIDQEVADADQAARTLIDAFLYLSPLRGDGGVTTAAVRKLRGRGPEAPLPGTLNAAKAAAALPKGVVSAERMLKFIQEIWGKAPLLQRLRAARGLPAAQKHAEVMAILKEFQRTTGIVVERVRNGVVQATRGAGNRASLRSRSGYLQIEEQVYQNADKLWEEVAHELPFHYSGGNYYTPDVTLGPITPEFGPYKLHQWLEKAIEEGIEKVVTVLSNMKNP